MNSIQFLQGFESIITIAISDGGFFVDLYYGLIYSIYHINIAH